MPWSQISPMDQKMQFIADYLPQTLWIIELCELYGVNRETGYKWIERSLKHGPLGLEERSRKPHSSLHHTSKHVVDALIEPRRQHPAWGAKKRLPILQKRHPSWPLPACSTVCDIFSRNGLLPKTRQRRHMGQPGQPTSLILASNDVWSADFKGQFKTGDGLYCYPLTVADGYSRLLLGCQALSSTHVPEGKPVFTRLFKRVDSQSISGLTTACPLPLIPSPSYHSYQLGGCAWASCRGASSPVNPSQTAAMNGCTGRSQPRPLAPRPRHPARPTTHIRSLPPRI